MNSCGRNPTVREGAGYCNSYPLRVFAPSLTVGFLPRFIRVHLWLFYVHHPGENRKCICRIESLQSLVLYFL